MTETTNYLNLIICSITLSSITGLFIFVDCILAKADVKRTYKKPKKKSLNGNLAKNKKL